MGSSKLDRNNRMERLYFDDKQTLMAIAEKFGVSKERVRQVIAKSNRKERHYGKTVIDEDVKLWASVMYLEGETLKDIGLAFKLEPKNVSKILREEFGADSLLGLQRRERFNDLLPLMVREYEQTGNLVRITKKYSVAYVPLREALIKEGFDIGKYSARKRFEK